MEFSQNRASGHRMSGGTSANNVIGANISSNDIKSDRLQKAIARNRAKQARRSGNSPVLPADSSKNISPKLGDKSFDNKELTRKSVGRPDNIEFTTDIAPSVTKKNRPTVSYTAAKRKVRTKSKNKKEKKYITYIVKFSWCFCLFLLFRLVFSGGGVVDYYSSLDLLKSKEHEYQSIIKENESLVELIKKIKSNSRYQRKLVRDNLGFIASNEYLILFPKKKVVFPN